MIIIYIVSFCFSATFAALFLLFNVRKSKLLCGALKAIATVILSVPAFRAFAVSQNVVYLLVAVAIVICACADFIIHYSFVPGAAAFMLAHCIFAPAFIIYGCKIHAAIIVFLVYAVICAFALSRIDLPPEQRFPATVYAAVIGVMVSFAVSTAFYGETFGIISAVSALLFLASDAMLAFGLPKDRSSRRDAVLMILYYSAIAGFALACVI